MLLWQLRGDDIAIADQLQFLLARRFLRPPMGKGGDAGRPSAVGRGGAHLGIVETPT